jgi:hypothetical protein
MERVCLYKCMETKFGVSFKEYQGILGNTETKLFRTVSEVNIPIRIIFCQIA